jgi:redox-sensitive bicupin YhaK (pirin superfamily)
MSKPKTIEIISRTYPTMEGGFEIRRAFPNQGLGHPDPFLMLDHMGPMKVKAKEKAGVSPHPHRGFETVTYMFEGEIHHKDSYDNEGDIGPGDMQWMTAASGIIHSEFPSEKFQETGGTLHGLQLWVNLPKDKKMSSPKYQQINTKDMPNIQKDGYLIRVLAGSYEGQVSPVKTQTPIGYYHLTLEPQAKLSFKIPTDWMSMLYVVSGKISSSGESIEEGFVAKYSQEGETIEIQNQDQPTELMILGGKPIDEPVFSYGPFVMNTEAEIRKAFVDFHNGEFTKEKAEL